MASIKVKIKTDEIIKWLDKNLDVSYRTMADKLGISSATLWRIHKRKYQSVKVALVLGMYAVGNPLLFIEVTK